MHSVLFALSRVKFTSIHTFSLIFVCNLTQILTFAYGVNNELSIIFLYKTLLRLILCNLKIQSFKTVYVNI